MKVQKHLDRRTPEIEVISNPFTVIINKDRVEVQCNRLAGWPGGSGIVTMSIPLSELKALITEIETA